MNMNSFIDIYRQVIFKPKEFFAKKLPEKIDSNTIIFTATNLLLMIIFSILFSRIFGQDINQLLSIKIILTTTFFMAFLLVFFAFVMHLLARFFKGDGNFNKSLLIVCYSTALSPFTSIPYLSVVFSLYQIYILALGFQKNYKLNFSKSLISVASPILLLLLIMFIYIYKNYPALDNSIIDNKNDSSYSYPTPETYNNIEDYPTSYPSTIEGYQ